MKPYDSFNQQNDHNGNERNAHLRNMGNHFMEGAYPIENQMMDVRTPPGPGPSYGGYNSVAGYRWRRSQQRWAYYGTDAHEIQYFHCY
ncbi:hypothetical protein [Peribacillus frigoritolerans]|uniref:hypothetical protein n=1 Tax=Peribacillus frigoritolerans TaxID=450367 RepID=UPI002416E471|nr:hypothetical protein [Peribacillus frigoritolerans]MDG4849248.1 hypothetical protein [Peribacillus frigoritolerans]